MGRRSWSGRRRAPPGAGIPWVDEWRLCDARPGGQRGTGNAGGVKSGGRRNLTRDGVRLDSGEVGAWGRCGGISGLHRTLSVLLRGS